MSVFDGTQVSHGKGWVVVRWEQPEDAPRDVIVVKSEQGHADDLREIFGDEPVQHAIYYDSGTQCQDQDVVPGVKYYYTVFMKDSDGGWHRLGREHATVDEYGENMVRVQFHPDGSFMSKVDTLRIGLFPDGGGGAV